MKKSALVIALAIVVGLFTSNASALNKLSTSASIDRLGSSCGHASVALSRGDMQMLHAGDKVCVEQTDGGSWCATVEAASTRACASYTCPTNSKVVDDGTSCGDCKSGTGTVADCKTCCDSFYDGADRINCKRNNC